MKSVKFNQQFSFNITKTISKTATVAICFILGGFLASCTSLPTSPAPEQVTPDTTAEKTETQLSTDHVDHAGAVSSLKAPKMLGVVVDPSMTIIDVDYYGAAKKEGIEVGDVLVSLDGISYATQFDEIRKITNLSEEIRTVPAPSEERPKKKIHEVIVLREGVVKQFNMQLGIPDEYIILPPTPPVPFPTAMPVDSNLMYH